jgi:hypothetical protein
MAKGQVRSNREAKKPKKEKPKVAASAPSLMKIATPPNSWNNTPPAAPKPETIRLTNWPGNGPRA